VIAISKRASRCIAALGVCAFAVLLPCSSSDAEMTFVDATQGSGIDSVNVCGSPKDKGWLTEYMGAGAAWLDYDGDGHLDLYVVNGSAYDRAPLGGEPNRLYRGDGRGGFTDVTDKAGVGHRGWGYGVAVGDYDNDGRPDLYVTNLGPNVLYRNRGDGTFEDATARAGVGDSSWGTSAAFFDMDADGDLDLYVANYVDLDPASVPRRGSKRATAPFCAFKGIPVVCGPQGLPPAQDVLYRNNGDGAFTDVTRSSGVWLDKPRYGLGVVTGDYDGDGDPDVYVANDSVPQSLWRNLGGGRFEDVALATLCALSVDGNPQAGMGTDFGDYDGDGWLDLVLTTFSHDLNTIYRNHAGRFFTDESSVIGMSVTAMALSWGTAFVDFDQDGDLDLFIANGHVYPEVDTRDIGTRFRQTNHLFASDGGRFREISARAGSGFRVSRSFRGAAFGDYDEDGDVDILVTALDEPALLLRNETRPLGHWLKLRLVGTSSNRDGVGARVTVTAGGKRMVRERKGGGSYLSASAPDLHFGLGSASRADLVEIRWPSGRKDVLRNVAVDRAVTVREGTP